MSANVARRGRVLSGFAAVAVLGMALAFSPSASAADAPAQGSTPMSTANSGDRAAAMDATVKADAFRAVLQQMGAGQKVDPKLWSTFVAAQNDGLRTGPKIGEKVPAFTLPDQYGKELALHQLMGPKGLLLVFLRSADW